MISVNPQYFREPALFFEKNGRYDDGIFDSYQYHEYWDRERHRCLYGHEVGGLRVTGYHYFYLNYWPIKKVYHTDASMYGEIFKNKTISEHKPGFPDFWDVDLEFFKEFELAQINGEHMLWLKPRGVGASFKGSSIAGANFFLYEESKSFLLAHSKEFLTDDGLFTKFLIGRMHINKLHPDEDRFLTAFGKPSDFKKDQNGMHFRASTNVDGNERGYMSEVIGVTFNDGDLQKHRGKRGKVMLIEEMGAFPGCETVYNVARSSVEQMDSVFGTILGFGTGGTKASAFGDMEKMFYAPKAYNLRAFDNKYDDGMLGTFCGYFTPAYRNVDEKDDFGNSLEKIAKDKLEKKRKAAAGSPDQNALTQIKSEHPFSPQEAILRNTRSPLPANEAMEWYHKVIASGLHKLGINGRLENIDGRIEFRPDNNLKSVDSFPHRMEDDLTGCVVQYYAPFKKNGRIPDGMYIIAHDPYAFDTSTDGTSLGAAYVYMQPNNLVPPGDRIVATYFGRPKTTDEYNRNLFMLAKYYNAKIGFENDRGDVIGYAKRFKTLDWLADEFELAFDADLPKSKVRRQFGMHIGSGKENLRMHKGNKYLYDWLVTTRGSDENGVQRLNLHTIYCPATLQEINQYRFDGGNFDRVSALRILAYYQKELVYKDITPVVEQYATGHSFFNTRHFL